MESDVDVVVPGLDCNPALHGEAKRRPRPRVPGAATVDVALVVLLDAVPGNEAGVARRAVIEADEPAALRVGDAAVRRLVEAEARILKKVKSEKSWSL
jgi:hypothetical protein